MSRVLVLGSSYDSLLAVHAASLLGHDVMVVSDGQDSGFDSGPNLLLNPIPLIDVACSTLRVENDGDPDVFLDKLLNQGGKGREPEEVGLDDARMIWDSKDVLNQLLDMYGNYVRVEKNGIGHKDVARILDELKPDITFSGMDRDEICGGREHNFQAVGFVTMQSPVVSMSPVLKLSGDPDVAWAMEFSIFGRNGRVYGGHRHPPVSREKLAGYIMPQAYSCDCWAADINFIGRGGAWDSRWPRHRSFYKPFAVLDRA